MSLADLARGLRAAGGVLSPGVNQMMHEEGLLNQRNEQAQRLMLLQRELDKQSPEYQMRVEALNNEKGFRQAVADARGDEGKIAQAAMQYGKPEISMNIINRKEDRVYRAQQAKDALTAKLYEIDKRSEDKSLDRESRERLATEAELTRRQLAAMTHQLALGQQEIKKLQFQASADKTLFQNTQKLGAALDKANLPEADAVLGAVEDAIKKTPELSEFLAGPKSKIPDFAVGMASDKADDIRNGRLAFQKLFNITLKNRSGAAVTIPEFERLKAEFANGAFKTSAQLNSAVNQARNIINKHYASVAAGFDKQTLDAYNENIRGFGGRVVISGDKDPLGIR